MARVAASNYFKVQQYHLTRLAIVQGIVHPTVSNPSPYIPEDFDGAPASTFHVIDLDDEVVDDMKDNRSGSSGLLQLQ